MSVLDTIIIAIVEGLTEFLPVSSTGHMIVVQHFLDVESTVFVKAFTVIIQFGAILSVLCLYWRRFFKLNDPKLYEYNDSKSVFCNSLLKFLFVFDFYWKLFVAFLPAAFFGLLFSDAIDELLESVNVVAVMLVLGGIFMLFADNLFKEAKKDQSVTNKNALYIGLFQCVAMIPGVSRSMATIVGAMSQKLNRKNAAEFSFFLAVPTMLAATAYKVLKLFLEPNGVDLICGNLSTLVIGNVVAFVVALLAIKFFIGFVTKYGFKFFGYYRILVGLMLLILNI